MHFAFSMSTVLLSLVMVTQTLAVPGVGLEPRQCGSTCANGGTDFRQLGAPCSGCDPAAQNYGRVCSYNALAVLECIAGYWSNVEECGANDQFCDLVAYTCGP